MLHSTASRRLVCRLFVPPTDLSQPNILASLKGAHNEQLSYNATEPGPSFWRSRNAFQQSMGILKPKDVGNSIRDAMGKSVLNSASTDVLLVAMMLDDSSSICYVSNEQAVRDGPMPLLSLSRVLGRPLISSFFLRYLNGNDHASLW